MVCLPTHPALCEVSYAGEGSACDLCCSEVPPFGRVAMLLKGARTFICKLTSAAEAGWPCDFGPRSALNFLQLTLITGEEAEAGKGQVTLWYTAVSPST